MSEGMFEEHYKSSGEYVGDVPLRYEFNNKIHEPGEVEPYPNKGYIHLPGYTDPDMQYYAPVNCANALRDCRPWTFGVGSFKRTVPGSDFFRFTQDADNMMRGSTFYGRPSDAISPNMTNTTSMFKDCSFMIGSAAFSQNEQATNVYEMYMNCRSLEGTPVVKWMHRDVSGLYDGATGLKGQPSMELASEVNATRLFANCPQLNGEWKWWDTNYTNLKDMTNMFYGRGSSDKWLNINCHPDVYEHFNNKGICGVCGDPHAWGVESDVSLVDTANKLRIFTTYSWDVVSWGTNKPIMLISRGYDYDIQYEYCKTKVPQSYYGAKKLYSPVTIFLKDHYDRPFPSYLYYNYQWYAGGVERYWDDQIGMVTDPVIYKGTSSSRTDQITLKGTWYRSYETRTLEFPMYFYKRF